MPTILVIDDEAPLLDMVDILLSNAGFKVETARSGPEGLQKAIAEQPEVIIVDVMMPEMDGYEVCSRLRNEPRTARSAIIVLTARGQPVDRGMALQSGADCFMIKPFQGKALVEQIQELLGQSAGTTPPLGLQAVTLRLARGAGATTLVANLALSLASRKEQLTVAADMALEGGQLSDRLDLPSAMAWMDPPGSDADWLATHLVRHPSGPFILPAREPVTKVGQPVPEKVEQLLLALRDLHDYVLLDTPLNLGSLAPVLLGSSSLVLLLLTPDVTSLQKAEMSLGAIRRFGTSALQVWPVLNKVRAEQQSFREQVESTLGLPVTAVLPWSLEECEEAVSSRRPMVLAHPRSPFSRAIQALADKLVQATSIGAQAGTLS
jgi:pilus assembly protein CpaE